MPQTERFAIKMLGGLSVATDQSRVETFPTKRSAMILCLVGMSRQGSVARDELAERLWPEDYLDATRLRLRQELKRLRVALGEASEILDSDRNWVRIDLERVEIDSREFERNIQLSKSAESATRQLQLLTRAIEAYEGPFLPEFYEDWALATRADLQSKYVDALSLASRLAAEAGDRNQAIEFATSSFRVEPTRTALAAQLMTLLLEAGQVEAANATLAAHTRALEKAEMGHPSAELTSLLRSAPTYRSLTVAEPAGPLPQAQLPKYHDLFCGRAQESHLIGQLLLAERGPRLITLIGPGGVGKTRLCVEVVSELSSALPGVMFFSLETSGGATVADRAADAAALSSPSVVILDNAETNLEAAIELAQKLRNDNPRLRIVVTSRQPLRVSGEQLIPIEPLPLPIYALSAEMLASNESVRLFENRVQAINPSFRVDASNASDVVRLLAQLDGLPLASEIAAGGVATLGIRGVSERIDTRLTELVSNRIDVPDRHRSLHAAIEWSYQDLSASQKEVFRALATLKGGGSTGLIEQLVGPGSDEVVRQLCDRSLLTRTESATGPRFRLLESIRIFAEKQTNGYEAEALRGTHGRAVLAWLIAVLPGSLSEEHWQQLEEEHENILAAIRWGQNRDPDLALQIADKIWRFWTLRGSVLIGRETLSALLATPNLERSPLLARVKHAYSVVLYTSRKFQECSDVLDQLEALAAELDEQFLLLTSRAMHGVVAMDLADYEQAYHSAKASWKGYAALPGYEVDAMISRATMARNAAFMGRAEEAILEMEAVFAERIERAIPFETARGYRELAEVYRETGKDAFPIALQEKSLSLYRGLTARPWLIVCLLDLHASYTGTQRFAEAMALEEELEGLAEKVDTKVVLGEIRLAQARRYWQMGELTEAKRLLAVSLEIAVVEGYLPLLLVGSLTAAQVFTSEGSGERAAVLVEQVRAIHLARGGGLMASFVRELDGLEKHLGHVASNATPLSPTALGAKALSFVVG